MVNGPKTKMAFKMDIIALQRPLWVVFPSLPWLPIATRVSLPFHIQATIILAKMKLILFLTRFELTTTKSQSKCTINSTNHVS